jgi:hypothetical protein
MPARLNVILHGLFAIHEQKSGLTVFLPDMGPVHSYRAGAWLGETSIRPGAVHTLKGVAPGHARFAPNINIQINRPGALPPTDKTHSTLHLPTPAAIASLMSHPVTPGLFTGADAPKLQTTAYPTIQVLTYDVISDDYSDVTLTDHPWSPIIEPGLPTQNVHIISEEELVESTHSLQAFDRSAEILGFDLAMTESVTLRPATTGHSVPPPGVHRAELFDFARRIQLQADLGFRLHSMLEKQISPEEFATDVDTLFAGPTPTASRIAACSTMVRSE